MSPDAAASAPGPASTEPAHAPAPPVSHKPVRTVIIDTNSIIRNDPSVSTLIASAEEIYSIPAVVSEIRDETTRIRFQTTLSPFLKLRTPRPESVQTIRAFARKTGDLQVLSGPDLQLLALTYEIELERNGGDWRLRKEPGQKGLNGSPPGREAEAEKEETVPQERTAGDGEGALVDTAKLSASTESSVHTAGTAQEESVQGLGEPPEKEKAESESEPATVPAEDVEKQLEGLSLAPRPQALQGNGKEQGISGEQDDDDDDGDGDGMGEWITPANIKKYEARQNNPGDPRPIQRVLQAALITADFAMRNVALRMNLNLLDTSFQRITRLKQWVLRCYGCFQVTKDTSRQFCPSCGQATLTRVSCSTDASSGAFRLHLRRDYQVPRRGNVYSIPKPTHGSANGKQANVRGGGKGGWGTELILAEDQKEYARRMDEQRRAAGKASGGYRDLMDEDYLPGILGAAAGGGPGKKGGGGGGGGGRGKVRIGAGRNVNAKRRR